MTPSPLDPPFVPPFRFPLPSDYLALWCVAAIVVLVATRIGAEWRQRRRLAGKSTWPANAFLSACLLGLVVVAAEGLFYRFADLSDSFAKSNVARRWFVRNVHENNWGYRDDIDYTFQPAAGKRRIVFLGDSFTFGHGVRDVEERFVNLVRRRLEQVAPGRYEVYALCYPGWSTRLEGALLNQLPSTGFRADWIVLVYVPNDAVDLPGLREEDSRLHDARARLQPKSLLLTRSYLPNFLYFRLQALRAPEARGYYDWASKGYESPYWEQHRSDLHYLPALSAPLGASFAVVTFPFLHGLASESDARIHRTLDQFWQAEGVRHLDLRETFSRHGTRELIVSRFDAHPNELAHRLAAEEIYRAILVPELGL